VLLHHSSTPYAVAASAAAASARQKLEALIDTGRTRAAQVIKTVMTQQPQDRLVRSAAMQFETNSGTHLVLRAGDGAQHLHPHALAQCASRVGLPSTYINMLQEPDNQPWGGELVAQNLGTLYAEKVAPDARFLLRSVGGEVRGFLSDRYRRLDCRPLVDSFARACSEIGALPFEGYAMDTKIAIKAVLPQIYEPIQYELMCYGAVLENSDYGNGALSIRTFAMRLVCTNCLITDTSIRQVHVGGRLADDIEWSEETHHLDSRRMASAVRDVVRGQLAPAKIDQLQAAIRKANEEKIDPRQAVLELRRSLTKGEAERAVEKYNSPDVETLPVASNTKWRLSNAVSWLAGQTDDTERKLELMKVAGALLPKAA
jgi:hypothetical protein